MIDFCYGALPLSRFWWYRASFLSRRQTTGTLRKLSRARSDDDDEKDSPRMNDEFRFLHGQSERV